MYKKNVIRKEALDTVCFLRKPNPLSKIIKTTLFKILLKVKKISIINRFQPAAAAT